jgi:hypothetical protein
VTSDLPVAFRRTGIGFLGHPVPAGELGLPHGRLTEPINGSDSDGVSTFRTRETRPGRVPSMPRGGGVHATGQVPPAAACRFPAASPAPRSDIPPPGAHFDEASSKGSLTLTRPVFPSPVTPGRDGESLGLNPELRTSPLPATHVRAGTGPNTSPSYATDITNLHQRSHSPHTTSCRTTSKVPLHPVDLRPQQSQFPLVARHFRLSGHRHADRLMKSWG